MSIFRIAIVTVLAAVLFAACGDSDPEPAPVPTATSTPIPVPTATATAVPATGALVAPSGSSGSAEEMLLSSFAAMDAVGTFHFELEAGFTAPEIGITTEIPLVLLGDFQAPDRMKASATVSLGLFAVQSQIIIIGETVYATDPQTGEWEVTSDPDLLLFNPLDFVGSDAPGLADFSSVVLVGTELLLGEEAVHIGATVPAESFGMSEGDVRVDLWIGAGDALLHQIKLEGRFPLDSFGSALGVGQLSGAADLRMTMTFSDFGLPVTIEAPILPAGQAAADGPGQRIPDQGREHVAVGAPHPAYNSVPATSGWHYGQPDAPAPWGVYDQVLPDEVLVHNLEHGGIGVHYDCPDGCPDLVATLSSLVSAALASGAKIVMSPYPGMDSTIALTAWNYLDTFDDLDLQRAVSFIDAHHASPNAPEGLVP